MIYNVLLSMRPRQWVKNLFVLAALIFSQHLFEAAYLAKALAAIACFVAVSGAVYLLNDILDLEQDRLYPEKRERPMAAGKLTVGGGTRMGGSPDRSGSVGGIQLCDWHSDTSSSSTSPSTCSTRGVSRTSSSSTWSSWPPDSCCARWVGQSSSPWTYPPGFILCTFTLTLFLTTVKRRCELVRLGGEAARHRPSLAGYGLPYLDQIISILASATLVCYALYAMGVSEGPEASRQMQWTIPFGAVRDSPLPVRSPTAWKEERIRQPSCGGTALSRSRWHSGFLASVGAVCTIR